MRMINSLDQNVFMFCSIWLSMIFMLNPHALLLFLLDNRSSCLSSLALSIFYLCLYLFFEWVEEYQRKKKIKASRKQPVDLSLAEINTSENPLIDIENPDYEVSTVLYKEQRFDLSQRAVIRIENLSKTFKEAEFPALNGITFEIPENEVFLFNWA